VEFACAPGEPICVTFLPVLKFPRLYAIIDAGCFRSASDPAGAVAQYARVLIDAGVTLIQYRNKMGSAREMLGHARELKRVAVAKNVPVRLIMNDRADLCLAAGFDGVHVGQDDLSPTSVRAIIGPQCELISPQLPKAGRCGSSAGCRWLGVSTHNPEQVREADSWPVDYIAVGPVFATASKANPDPVIGLEGVRRARSLTQKPLVAIGGITQANCTDVIEAGADTVAIISALMNNPEAAAREFLAALGKAGTRSGAGADKSCGDKQP
jgi:thiamine-phosphate pyrophosphorylase